MQALMGTLCRVYSAQVENGAKYTPIAEGQVGEPDRRHGDGEWAVARRQSRSVRTRNVAKLDGAVIAPLRTK